MSRNPSQRPFRSLLIVLSGIFVAIGCTTHTPPLSAAPPMSNIVEATALNKPAVPVRVLDVRDQEAFLAGHVPGAVRVDYDEWKQLSMDVDTGLALRDAWVKRLNEFGIDADTSILIYDNGSMTHAARVWFIIQHFGLPDVAIVNGGFPAIQQANVQLLTGPDQANPNAVAPRIHADPPTIGLIDRHELRASIDDGDVQILDARSFAEYTGADPMTNARAGHLPDAINVPHTTFLDESGRLRDPEALDRILASAGFRKGIPIVTHCQGGGRAALAALAAQRAGYGPVFNYYLSFGDWAADASCPIVRGTD